MSFFCRKDGRMPMGRLLKGRNTQSCLYQTVFFRHVNVPIILPILSSAIW